ncbi:MAG: homoserine O-acetyltransferase [Calditrichaeota bacterium]|nr:homoserine O-acetyltransferase [Calditrichota bacterium]
MKKAYISEQQNGLKLFHQAGPFTFKSGAVIDELILAFETYGELSEKKDNVVVVHHALSTGSHVASHSKNKTAGWWETMVGPSKPIDTNQVFVICINNLSGCYGSSGPSTISPRTNKPYQLDFPITTFSDIVQSQKILIDFLGIDKIQTIVGCSVGGMTSLQWALDFPDSVNTVFLASTCHKAYPANVANRTVQREIIQLDPDWKNGYYQKNPTKGLMIARKLGFYTYKSQAEFNRRFEFSQLEHPVTKLHDKTSEIEHYLEYNAAKFTKIFDANSYLYITKAMDLYNTTDNSTNEHEAFKRIKAKVTVLSVNTDILFPPFQQEQIYLLMKSAGVDVNYVEYQSTNGHDTFLIETDEIGRYINELITDRN